MLTPVVGALLGTPSNRDVSVANSFELVYTATSDDVDMSSGAQPTGRYSIDAEFFQTRSDQCEYRSQVDWTSLNLVKDVFPTLEVVGWYTVGTAPTADDVALHKEASLHQQRVDQC